MPGWDTAVLRRRLQAAGFAPHLFRFPTVRETLARRVARGEVTLRSAVEQLKRDVVATTMDETGGNWAEAARRLGMNRSNLHHMARRLGVRRR